MEAARRAKVDPIGLVVADRPDADMLRMIAHENSEEFRSDALVGVETIAALVIEAYGRGEIELDSVEKEDKGRQHLPGGKCYSLATVARGFSAE